MNFLVLSHSQKIFKYGQMKDFNKKFWKEIWLSFLFQEKVLNKKITVLKPTLVRKLNIKMFEITMLKELGKITL